MTDNRNQSDSWNAAGRVAALCLAVVMFAGIWESDSTRIPADRSQGEASLPVALNPVWTRSEALSAVPVKHQPAVARLDRTLRRDCGLIRIQVHLQPLADGSSELLELNSEHVFEGDIEDLKNDLLSLLRQLDSGSHVLPVYAQIEDTRPEPVVAEPAVTPERGFIFLSRRPGHGPTADSHSLEFRPGLKDSAASGALREVEPQPTPRKLQSRLIHGALNLAPNSAD